MDSIKVFVKSFVFLLSIEAEILSRSVFYRVFFIWQCRNMLTNKLVTQLSLSRFLTWYLVSLLYTFVFLSLDHFQNYWIKKLLFCLFFENEILSVLIYIMILTQTRIFVKAHIFVNLNQQFRLMGYKLFYIENFHLQNSWIWG
jgi:hypothetical protein